jgi:2'-5' RNA ligase
MAIELPESIKVRISTFVQELRVRIPDPAGAMRWANPDQFHLTLKFLGECQDDEVSKLHQALEQTVKNHTAFGLGLEGVGSFKSGRSLKVLWMGVSEGKERLVALAKDLNEACSAVGFPDEKKTYHPHLTLARSKESISARTLESIIRQMPLPAIGPTFIENVSLIQSVLSPTGAHYTTLCRVPFSAGLL